MYRIRRAVPSELGTLIAIDDAASELYTEAGLEVSFGSGHPFVVAETERWRKAVGSGQAHIAVDEWGAVLGFVVLGMVDGAPYLDQVSVHTNSMRKGIGSKLLQFSIEWSGARPLWLTTYAHLEWNMPYYERMGFEYVAETLCGPEICAILADQRKHLPDPDKRVAMVRRQQV